MNCHRCFRQGPVLFHRLTILPSRRLLSNASASYQQQSPPAATSTSAAQPFSTPFTPPPSESTESTKISTPSESAEPSRPKSSLQAGTVLRGLAFLKNSEPPVAREDNEYPDWLWGLLDQGKYGGKGKLDGGSGEGDAFCKPRLLSPSIHPTDTVSSQIRKTASYSS